MMNEIEKAETIVSEDNRIESVDELFHLYYRLIQPLKNFEELCDRQDNLKNKMQEAEDTVKSAFFIPFIMALKFTLILAIPFVIIFLIVANICHTGEGVKLFDAYDNWITHTSFGEWFLGGVDGSIHSGIFAGLLGIIVMFIVLCGLTPVVVFLLPAMFIFSVLITIGSVISAKSTIKNGNEELPQLNAQIEHALGELTEPLSFVPPDYRFSAAVEHFCQSYSNGKASTLKEAVILFDNYVHQMKMEQGQQEILESHREVLRKLDDQSAQLRSLERQVGKVKDRVDSLYWR